MLEISSKELYPGHTAEVHNSTVPSSGKNGIVIYYLYEYTQSSLSVVVSFLKTSVEMVTTIIETLFLVRTHDLISDGHGELINTT